MANVASFFFRFKPWEGSYVSGSMLEDLVNAKYALYDLWIVCIVGVGL